MKKCLVFLLFILCVSIFAQTSWVKLNTGTTIDIRVVQFISSSTGFAVGSEGLVLSTEDGGTYWKRMTNPDNDNYLGVFFVSNTTGWVCGNSGKIFKTTNGGLTWIQQNSGTGVQLDAIFFQSSTIGWIVGKSGILLKTYDGGLTWANQSLPTNSQLEQVKFINDNVGWVIGDGGTVFKTTNAGSTWVRQNSGVSNWLLGLQIISETEVWIIGNGGTIIKTTDGGNTWLKKNFLDTSQWLEDIYFISNYEGWMVTGSSLNTIYHTIDGGENWLTETLDANNAFYFINFINNNCYIAGSGGAILWKSTQSSNNNSIPCVDVSTITYNGKIYNTVKIGTQCWLKENLDIGDMILVNQNPSNNNSIEKYCYKNDPNNCTLYGGLYQWNEAMQYGTTTNGKGICPNGWHIPSASEFQSLINSANGDGNALKSIGQGSGNAAGTNTTGFSALLLGTRDYDGKFTPEWVGNATYWSQDQNVLGINAIDNSIYFGTLQASNGYYIRCLSDVSVPLNNNPIANAGSYQTHDCVSLNGKLVTLHAENSTDQDNDPLTFLWSENGNQIANGVTPQILLLGGVHTITLTVNDGKGGTSTDEVVITVNIDNVPPIITPPNSITVITNVSGGFTGSIGQATAVDNCDSSPKISNNAPTIIPLGINKITLTATDVSGNSATADQEVTVIPITIVIDIKPGSDENPINLKSKGVIPVAILTVENFDAISVDVATLKFGPKGVAPVKNNLEDVDKDGDLDLILHFDTQSIGLISNSTSVDLIGKTKLGVDIKGSDKVKIVPGLKKEGFEIESEDIIPTEFLISQNYPNPFNPITIINYQLPVSCYVSLKVYDIQGREVSTLVHSEKPAGIYNVTFDGNNLPSGIYLYKLQAGNFVDIKKMMLIK